MPLSQHPISTLGTVWEMPELLALNRLPMRPTALPYPSSNHADTPWQLSLNGDWSFRHYSHPSLVVAADLLPGTDDSAWAQISVPGNWTRQGYEAPHYTNVVMPFSEEPPHTPATNGTGVYRRVFELPQGWRHRRVALHIGGAESLCLVYLNGEFIGLGKDSRLPSEFDLTQALQPGRNCLAIVVVRYCDGTWLEDQDHWFMAGLHRQVFLYSTGESWIQALTASGVLLSNGVGQLSLRAQIEFRTPTAGYRVRFDVTEPNGRVARIRPQDRHLSPFRTAPCDHSIYVVHPYEP